MISYIKGTVSQINENSIVLDNHGIGYLINMPVSSLYKVAEGCETTIYTFMAFGKEDVSLCGFLSTNELNMFQMLLKVNGIGPKGALSILSAVDVETLKMAIAAGDDKLIAAGKGISSKTAQKIIVELKGKINKDLLTSGVKVAKKMSSNEDLVNDAINTVVATGFDRTSCMKALTKIEITKSMTVDDIIDEIFANINI